MARGVGRGAPGDAAAVASAGRVTFTASFRLLYVFVVIEHGSRRLLHVNVTAHPTAAWTLQQLREVIGIDCRQRFLLHDRDSMITRGCDGWVVRGHRQVQLLRYKQASRLAATDQSKYFSAR